MNAKKLSVFIFAFLFIYPVLVFAGEGTAGDYMADMASQFGRGLVNIVTSPAEIPCTMSDDIQSQGGVGAVTGLGKGLAFFVRRVVVGVSELGTFFMPAPPVLPTVCTKPQTSSPGISN